MLNFKSLFFLICTFLFQNNSFCQSKNAAYVELLGNGLVISANYDMRFSNKAGGLGGRIGFGYLGNPTKSINSSVYTFPVVVNYLIGKEGKFLEIGAGFTYVTGSPDFSDIQDEAAVTFTLMYRSQPLDGGFMWKIGFSPILGSESYPIYFPGVSFGYSW